MRRIQSMCINLVYSTLINVSIKKRKELEYYAVLIVQPINFEKTEATYSARAIGSPKFEFFLGVDKTKRINWVNEFKYLGYWISPKIRWSKMIKKR